MPIKDIMDTLDTVNESLADELQTIIGRNLPGEPGDKEAKLVDALIKGTASTSQTIMALLAKDQISEKVAERQLKELAAKSELKLKELRVRGEQARAAKMTDTSSKLEVNEQKQAFTATQKAEDRALKKELPLVSAEAEAEKAMGKAKAKVYTAEQEPLAAYRAEREIQRLKDDGAYQTAKENYAIHHGRMKHAIKIGAPLPEIPEEALKVMEAGNFRGKLTTLRNDTISDRKMALEKDKIAKKLHDPVALQPMESIVLQGGSHKPLLPHALKVQEAVTEATGALFKQGFDVAPGAEKVSLLKQPLWGGSAKTEAATEGIKRVLSLIGKTGEFDPASVGSVAQTVKAAGKMGGMTKLGIGGVGAYLLAKLLGGGEKAPEMTQEQQMMLAQQMQEQQQKAALVQSLIQQRQASSENDMAKAMLLKMQMMQGAGGGGGGVL